LDRGGGVGIVRIAGGSMIKEALDVKQSTKSSEPSKEHHKKFPTNYTPPNNTK
jgi:hypothetical protein